jgi:broad specificity phosphatase PhoE
MRHGQTSWDSLDPKLNRINGWSSEGLDPEGKQQVQAQLPPLKEAGITGILSSDLWRAEETANLVGEALDQNVVLEYGLRCWFLGMYAGQKELVAAPLVKFFEQHPDEPVPFGESFSTYSSRVLYTLGKVEDYALRHPEKCLLVVTHGSCIEMYANHLKGLAPGQKQLGGFPPAGLYDVMFSRGRWFGKGRT